MAAVFVTRLVKTPLCDGASMELSPKKGAQPRPNYQKKVNMRSRCETRLKFVLNKLTHEYDEIAPFEKHTLLEEVTTNARFIRMIEHDIKHMERHSEKDTNVVSERDENNLDL